MVDGSPNPCAAERRLRLRIFPASIAVPLKSPNPCAAERRLRLVGAALIVLLTVAWFVRTHAPLKGDCDNAVAEATEELPQSEPMRR